MWVEYDVGLDTPSTPTPELQGSDTGRCAVSDSLFDRIVAETENVLQPIVVAIDDPGLYETLLQSLGLAGNDAASGGILAALRHSPI